MASTCAPATRNHGAFLPWMAALARDALQSALAMKKPRIKRGFFVAMEP